MKSSALKDRFIECFLIACLVLAITTMQGCINIKPVRVGVEYCEHAEPILFDSDEQVDLTPAPIVRRIVTHNEVHESLCKKPT